MPGMFAHVPPFLETIIQIREAYPEIDENLLRSLEESAHYHDTHGMASRDGHVCYAHLFRLMDPHTEDSDEIKMERKREAWNFACEQLKELHAYIRRLVPNSS